MSARRLPEGPPPQPVVQRLRVRYARRGRMRFSSSRDFARALERALRRAGVPMAYSAGFHPHPKISYANGAPTGMASEAEYVELGLARACEPSRVGEDLDAALPAGLDILEVVVAGRGSLGERLEASQWRIEFPDTPAIHLEGALARLLAVQSPVVSRMFRTGRKDLDVGAALLRTEIESSARCAILHVVVRHTTPAVRPDDILNALRAWAQFVPPTPPRVTRMAQGPWVAATAQVADPLAADKSAAASDG